ncbi:DUF3047 domain-containing protein [Sulfurisoma sediminicola]|uniref:DUF3047 family protein n=1 Tax=Sulfurisoma sediminicola TaxID=1381557 RepID=A0A497XK66_9PROT|nr:DUF3047 domain-containing protein [Sulfurisoma sediminicola]RLJ68264.1 hypothetical protein DFR35_0818 [Sulfurisoma sediminicola]
MTVPYRVLLVVAALAAGPALAQGNAPAPAKACEPRALHFEKEAGLWKHAPFSALKRDTVYTLLQDDGRTVLRGTAEGAASLYTANLAPPVTSPAGLSWRWKTDALVPGADNRDKGREDAPLRVIVGFDGDRANLPAAEQKRFKRAERLSGKAPPYAVLMYIWSDHVPVGTVIPSAHTSQIKMLVVTSGKSDLGQWQAVRRNLADDYRRAYGGEPGPLLGVAVMTDTDNTGAKAVGYYADIKLECAAN